MVAVVGIINNEGKILIGKKRSDSTKFLSGKWHIPGGSVEEGERYEEALIREIREETGLEISVGRYIGSHKTPTSRREARCYECFYVSGELRAGDDLEEGIWVPRNQVLTSCDIEATQLWSKEVRDYFNA